MKDLLKFIKSSGIYFLGNVLMKSLTFIMIPIYTRYINSSDFGTYDLNIAYITFLCSVLFLDIWSAIMRFMFDYKKDEEKYKSILSGVVVFFLSTIVYTLLIVIISNYFDVKYIFWIYMYGLLMNFQNLFGYIARGFGKNILYVVSGLVGSCVTVILCIVLLIGFKMDYKALFISSCFGFLVNILIILISLKFVKNISKQSFDKDIFRKMLIFSLPLCVNSVIFWFLTSYNKVIVVSKLGVSQNGIFAIAMKFSVIISLVTYCFQMSWQELAFSKTTRDKEVLGSFYTKAINLYLKMLFIGTLIIVPVTYIIFPIMVDKAYSTSINLIPLCIVATVASAFSAFLGSIFGSIKKTNVIFTTTVFGCILNILCINLLITQIGLQAASLAMFLGFLLNIILRIRYLKKFMPIKIDYKSIALFVFLIIYISLSFLSHNIYLNLFNVIAFITILLIIYRVHILKFIKELRKLKV
ncbi:MAG TPA: lipopolysaccharide biosynthesis protein [Bacilli bacterium]|nr:lipopolysaccharide biosynthesis protein [Bacilli bacterium]